MALDPKLLEILACPEDKGPLLYFVDEDALYNPRLHRRYAVREDIPIMLIDEAEAVSDAEHERLTAKATADGVQPDLRGVTADSLGFLDAVRGLPEQLAAAHEAALEISPSDLPSADEIDNIVVVGMGGSGIAGDVLEHGRERGAPGSGHRAQADAHARVRRAAHARVRARRTPAGPRRRSRWPRAVSTPARGSWRSPAAVSSASSPARAAGWSCPAPTGYMPRAALGALVAPLLCTLYCTGLMPDAQALLVKAQEQLARRRDACRPEVEGAANPAREIARRIDRTIPLIYGGGALGAVAAYRWKCDVNENAKAPAFWNAYPELDHNEICGWGQHGDVTRQVFTLVELRHGFEHERLAPRFAITTELDRGGAEPGDLGRRPKARVGSRSSSTSCTSATG